MRFKKRYSAVFLVILIILFLITLPYWRFLTKKVGVSPLKTLLSFNSIRKIDNSVNILILGIPGAGHDGPYLSDSITVANYNFKKNRLITIGIPRDIWSHTLRDRINSAYAYGEEKVEDGGFKLARAEVGAIVGVPIQYAAVINFKEFGDLVDFFGGVDVDVQRSFTDRKFPIKGKENDLCGGGDTEYKCRYETVRFEKGGQHMDGVTALKFVRSRNAIGAEGSDFARNLRQQLVMMSLKEQIIDIVKSLNLSKIDGMYENLNALVSRDMTNQQVAILAKRILFKKNFYQKSFHLGTEMFEVPDYRLYDGKYVLVPPGEDFGPIHDFVECLIEKEDDKLCETSNTKTR